MTNTELKAEVTYFIPTREQITSLKVGDMALDCFGHLALVTEVTCCKPDVNGKMFVCYYTQHGNGTISMSLKEDELTRTVQTSMHHKSAELDAIERRMLSERNSIRCCVDPQVRGGKCENCGTWIDD